VSAVDEAVLAPPVGARSGEPAPDEQARTEVEEAPAASPVSLVVVWRGLVVLGLVLCGFGLYLFALSGFQHDRAQRSLEEQLRADLVSRQTPIGGAIPPGTPLAMLEVPALGLRQVVLEGSTSSVTRNGPGHLRATPLPGQPGNAVILGHRSAFGAPFSDLGSLRRGDRITVTTGQGVSRFRIVDVTRESAGTKSVLTSRRASRLTLITAKDAVVGDGWLVARADLVGRPKTATAHLGTLSRTELGLAGDAPSWGALLAWLQALLAAALLTVWLLRRYPRWSVWLVAGPVLVVLAWQVFAQLALRLPSTL
jgi:sortase A